MFLGGWLRAPYAVLGCLVLLAGLAGALRRARVAWTLPHPAPLAALLLAAGFAWAAFGGAGHLLYANRHDWIVRDALLADLVSSGWPPAYGGIEAQPMILRTALGYFLPAALAGKVLGFAAADLALYAWTGLGVALFLLLLPLPQRVGARLALALAVVAFFSGMDLLGQVLDKGWPKPAEHIEWWSVAFQYSSMSTQLFWTPNHALAAWIATALFYRHWQRPEGYDTMVLAAALLVAWTPFAALGVAPFLALQALQRLRLGQTLTVGLPVAAACAVLAYVFGRLYTLDLAELPLEATLGGASNAPSFLVRYFKFTLIEFGVLAILLYGLLRHSFGLFWVACAVLLALPLVRFGPSNDLMLRASIPALVVLLILVLRAIEAIPAGESLSARTLLLFTVLGVGAMTARNEFWRALALPAWKPSASVSLADIARGGTIPNYFGRLDRPDLKAILRPPARVEPRR